MQGEIHSAVPATGDLNPFPAVRGQGGCSDVPCAPSSPTAITTTTGATTWPANTSGSTPAQPKASTHSVPDPPHSKRAAPKRDFVWRGAVDVASIRSWLRHPVS